MEGSKNQVLYPPTHDGQTLRTGCSSGTARVQFLVVQSSGDRFNNIMSSFPHNLPPALFGERSIGPHLSTGPNPSRERFTCKFVPRGDIREGGVHNASKIPFDGTFDGDILRRFLRELTREGGGLEKCPHEGHFYP